MTTEYRFRCDSSALEEAFLNRAFFSSWGRVPHRSHPTRYRDGILTLSIPEPISGTVSVLVPHPQLGVLLESTDTLMARQRPYHLLKELCRGALGRLQRWLFEWQMAGVAMSGEIRATMKELMRSFSQLVACDETSRDVDRAAMALLAHIRNARLTLSQTFSQAVLTTRLQTSDRIPLLMVADMTTHTAPDSFYEFSIYADELKTVFHAMSPIPTWSEIETTKGHYDWERLDRRIAMAHRYGFQIVGGPIFDFTTAATPTWIAETSRQEGALEAAAEAYLRAMLERFDHAVCLWSLVRSINRTDLMGLPHGRVVALVRRLSEIIRSQTSEKIVMVGVEQPWGDGNVSSAVNQHPFQLIETIFSMDCVDAVVLELHLGIFPHDSFPRDTIGFSSLIDFWWHSGKNVFISLSVPSDVAVADDTGTFETSVPPTMSPLTAHSPTPSPPSSITATTTPAIWSLAAQEAWIRDLMPLFLAKRSIAGFFWSPLQDTGASPATTAGLIDADRTIKPAFRTLVSFRQNYIR